MLWYLFSVLVFKEIANLFANAAKATIANAFHYLNNTRGGGYQYQQLTSAHTDKKLLRIVLSIQ